MIGNPCNKCIVRPICKNKCLNLSTYISIIEAIMFFSLISMFTIIMFSFLIISYVYYKPISVILLVLILIISIIIFLSHDDFDGIENSNWNFVVKFSLFMVVIPLSLTFKVFEKINETDIAYYKMKDLKERHGYLT